jgi:electron transfer flavoprotein alpha subunit
MAQIVETVLFLAHTEAGGDLPKAALEALGAAVALCAAMPGSRLIAGLVGETTQPAADRIATCGAERVLAVHGSEFGQSRYSTDAAAAEAICREARATLVLAPATSRWNRSLPGVAQRLNGRVDTHIIGCGAANGTVSVSRWYYRQRMEAALARTTRPWILLLEPGCFAAWCGDSGTAAVTAVNIPLTPALQRSRVTGYRAPQSDQQTIRPDARLLFVAGAGWTKKQKDGQPHIEEASALILIFLTRTRASLGSSKSLVDLSGEGQAVLPFLTHLNQVGQTGSTPRHPKGLSTCCHGEEPHVVGWRFINDRRAINLDPNCGWARGKADVLYVADAFEVVKKLNELMAE